MSKEYMKYVLLQGVIYDHEKKTILIGKRENDPYIKELSWTFIGGSLGGEDELEDSLVSKIKSKTGISVKVEKLIFAKTYSERREFLSIYYLCEKVDGEEAPAGDIHELKWVKPSELDQYFTTSLHSWLFDYLKKLG